MFYPASVTFLTYCVSLAVRNSYAMAYSCVCGVFAMLCRLVTELRFMTLTVFHHYRIQTWALEEARRRLEKEGILEDPDTLQKD
jgi:hypothetical protein